VSQPKPRRAAHLVARRHEEIMHEVYVGKLCLKGIAFKVGLSESATRAVIWRRGFHNMLVSEAERKMLIESRQLKAKAA
jgi:hypothetical protein